MNLNGWDTTSVVAIDLVNHALEQNTGKLVTRFEFRDDPILMRGTFGPWRIVPGGSLQKLHVEIPITDGWIRGVMRSARTKLTGTVLTVEIGLRLLPRADAKDTHDLVFDLSAGDTPEARPIRGIDIRGTGGKLSPEQIETVHVALVDCLNAHAEQVAFVFASVEARGTAADGWLQMPWNDFTYVETVRGRHYLALMGSRKKPTPQMTPDRFDPKLLEGQAPACFALSHELYLTGLLLPWLNASFRPKARFKYAVAKWPDAKHSVAGVVLQSPVALPKSGDAHPALKSLVFSVQGSALAVSAHAEAHVGAGCHLQVKIDMTMPMALDPATGAVSIRSDPRPRETHWFDANNPFGWMVAAGATILEWLVPHLRDQISGTVQGFARGMQGQNNPLAQPKVWNGVRDFKPSRFVVSPFIWFADTREVAPLSFAMPGMEMAGAAPAAILRE